MYYIVLDLEFNQPFPFKTGEPTELCEECPFEIIQIGAVKLDEDFQLIDQFNYLIQPAIYKRLHPFVEKITGITMEKLKGCPSFPEAYTAFVKFIGKDESVLCTWGVDDIKALFRNILYYKLDPALITQEYINVQQFASSYLQYEAGKTIGLKNAVSQLNLPIETEFHDALNDADYTGKIFRIVRPKKIMTNTFNISDLKQKKEPRMRLDTKALVLYFEKFIGRTLTDEEIGMLKAAYKLGRKKTFEIECRKIGKAVQQKKGKKTKKTKNQSQ